MQNLELALFKRQIVTVLVYLDEFPGDYVKRNGGGGFEAIATRVEKRDDFDEAVDLMLGTFGGSSSPKISRP